MIILEYLKVILIGIVEGITEWLPVSSTGHMILLERILPLERMSPEFYSMFLYVIQLAAIFAVVCFFFHRLNPFSRTKNEAEKKCTWRIWLMVLIGILPAGIVGVALDDLIDEYVVASDYGPFVVAATLILYGVLYIILERLRQNRSFAVQEITDLSPKQALFIGLFQCLSIIPGTSRSGSTILGGMALGVSRVAAAEYSFFMAIPIMAGMSLLKVGKYVLRAAQGTVGYTCTSTEIGLLVVGSIAAFLISFVCIRFLMDFVRRHSFEVFGWYRIALGLLVILYFSIVG
ncbi:MAG: undecaprenyl-diphosphate phosphatase [Clostridia bacterium]|nr:undecaprenyl-diphosphate phosphatase [Clostridia bacterium]